MAEKNKIVFLKSYGFADRQKKIPNTADTRFRIASLTKQFTAVLIMQLVEAGKINLQMPITKYLPYYRKDLGNQITIENLLTHTSGLPEYTEREDFFTEISNQKYAHKTFVERFCCDSILSPPGTRYKYSNTGYYILGAIIEEVTGEDYDYVLKKNILDVAGMKNTGLEDSRVLIEKMAVGYTYSSDKYAEAEKIDLGSTIFSAGAIYSTSEDLLLWEKALFSGMLISQKSLDRMITPFLDNYGYGVGITRFTVPDLNKEMHFIFHQGAINGFRSLMTYIVNEDIVIIILCNNFDAELNPINNAIFSILHNQQYTDALGKKYNVAD